MNKMLFIFTTIVFLNALLFQAVSAKVISSDDSGFTIESSVFVSKSQQASYEQFLRVDQWWNGEHSWFGSAENFSLDATAGGCFCEISGDKQVMHMRVVFVNPNTEIRMLGGLGPLQAMALNGAASFKFTSSGDQTTITHRYTVNGYMEGGLKQLAAIVDGVQTEQLERLAAKLNNDS